MDKQTKHYRQSQFDQISRKRSEYYKTIQIHDPEGGKTNHLNISDTEFAAIVTMLTT